MDGFDDLDEFFRSFADALFAQCPSLREHATEHQGVLKVELQPGRKRAGFTFWLSTEDEEVTVGLGVFHSHFDWPAADAFAESDALLFVQSLMRDEVLIEDRSIDGRCSGSHVLEPGESVDASSLAAGHVVRVRSWSGKRDRTFHGRELGA